MKRLVAVLISAVVLGIGGIAAVRAEGKGRGLADARGLDPGTMDSSPARGVEWFNFVTVDGNSQTTLLQNPDGSNTEYAFTEESEILARTLHVTMIDAGISTQGVGFTLATPATMRVLSFARAGGDNTVELTYDPPLAIPSGTLLTIQGAGTLLVEFRGEVLSETRGAQGVVAN